MKRNTWALGLAILLSLGCTRQVSDSTKISLSLGSLSGGNGAQAVTSVTHIVINVRGPLIPSDIVWNWDAHQGGAIVAPPSSIVLDVPKGADRLFQILVVQENESGNMQFLYGDAIKTLASANEDVMISVTSIGGGSGTEANVGGRYINADGSFPTGALDLMFQPPGTGRPAMKIFSTTMIAGWFQLFLIDGAPFSYRWVHDGTYLYNGVGYTDAEFSPAASSNLNYKVHFKIPQGYGYYQKDGGVYVTETRAASRMVAGYFGPGAATYGKKVCYSASSNIDSMYTDIAHTTPMVYDPNTTNTAKAIRLNNEGGLPASDSQCTSGVAFTDRLMIDGKYAGSGKDRAFGFRNVFISPSNASTITNAYNAGTQELTLSWNTLPDVSNVIDGFTVYAHPTFSGSMETGGDGVDCDKLQGLGFSWVGDTASNNITFPVTATNQATTKAAVCPYKNNYAGKAKYVFTGTRYENHGGGASGGPMIALRGPSNAQPARQLANGTCQNFEILRLNNGTPVADPSSLTVMVTKSGPAGGGTLYELADCTGAQIASSTQISANASAKTISYVSSSNGYMNFSFSATGYGPSGHMLAIYSASDADALIVSNIPATSAVNRCVKGTVLLQNNTPGDPALNASSTNVTMAYAGVGGGVFYSDPACSTALNSSVLVVPPLTQSADFYFKATLISSAASMTATAGAFTQGSTSLTVGTANVTTYGGNIHSPPSYYANTCYSFEVNPKNEVNARVPVAAATTLTVSTGSSGMTLYTDGSCGTSGGSSGTSHDVVISSNEDHSPTLSFKGTIPTSITINYTSPGPINGSTSFSLF